MKSIQSKLMASLKIWVVIYPSITLFLYLWGDTLAVFPLGLRTLILTGALVPWIVFVGVPFIEFILRTISRTPAKTTVKSKS